MTPSKPRTIVSAEWLRQRLGRDDIVIADCRFDLTDPAAGRLAYERDHVPGAVYFDLDKDLSGPVTGRGGRHPLPDMDRFAELLGRRGVGDGVTVICYDDQGGQMAARLWWLLRYAGHDDAAVLDGGYGAWRAAGGPVSAEVPAPAPRRFVLRLRPHMAVGMEDVRRIVDGGRDHGLIVDSRAPERYRGEAEPLDPVAGHIPGARNWPWMENLDQRGFFRGRDELEKRFAALPDDMERVVFHCGSGVSACVNLLVLEHIGRPGAKLYTGGWSDWCSVPENPVAVGDEPAAEGAEGEQGEGP